jgi:hypothetical protein
MWYFIAAAPMTYDPEESLGVLSRTIAAHAKQLADDEWRNEHAQILSDILGNSGITDTLSIDGREIPIESVIKAIRESFLAHRSKQLVQKLTDQVVTAAFKKVTEKENR